ncbi:DUF1707 SHOCT-like domain-containing protein [Geodermatophilus ruber]|uniref:DUF1707 domain-containing protein n=1 Tax=Geodermatophilus ruber TaxID=504800 RepID=A0A1I4AEU4_9ACTN|nr:DUF1707 domain-containing protein [Geodermatophilus ruber]SFK54833.1 protein of unknown function [Geodermatophilus ruber]
MTPTPAAGPDPLPGSAPGPRLRASDADRAATVAALEDAVGRGLLTHEEGGERMVAALSARFLDELPPLTADLPPAVAPADHPVTGWRGIGSAVATQVRSEMTAGLRSRRVLIAVLVIVGLLIALAVLGGLAMEGIDGAFEHLDL